MKVYEFNKNLLVRYDESINVLGWANVFVPPSQVRTEWAYFIEVQIEPTGWQALWKIPRVICEALKLRFPTVVLGYVEQCLFKECKAVFRVRQVLDADVHLPDMHEVALEDLFPTLEQENTELNVERTADCLDQLRFFYKHVWMPWDNDTDDDFNWVDKYLETRIRFVFDLRSGGIRRQLAAYIRTLLVEAKYLQQRRDYLGLGMSDDEEDAESFDKSQITDLMRLHLRMEMIRSELEMLSNPELRRIYEDTKFGNEKHLKNADNSMLAQGQTPTRRTCYIVTTPQMLERQIKLLQFAEQLVPKNSLVHMNQSLQDVLSTCDAWDNIYLSPGRHNIKYLEYLNDDGCISGLTVARKYIPYQINAISDKEDVIIGSSDDNNTLLVFDGHFTLENLVLDCQKVRAGLVVKKGKVCLKNCLLIGDGKSSTQEGIICCSDAELILEKCMVENFATAIIMKDQASLRLINTNLHGNSIGLDLHANVKLHFNNASIYNAERCGIYIGSMALSTDTNSLKLEQLGNLLEYSMQAIAWDGDCTFNNCKSNVYILNSRKLPFDDSGIINEDSENWPTALD